MDIDRKVKRVLTNEQALRKMKAKQLKKIFKKITNKKDAKKLTQLVTEMLAYQDINDYRLGNYIVSITTSMGTQSDMINGLQKQIEEILQLFRDLNN